MPRDPGGAQEYLQVQVRTASREDLLLLLLDGAVRFAERALEHLEGGRREEKCELLIKTQNIVLELIQSLSPAVGDKIYNNLIGLYKFIYRRLVEANLKDDRRSLDEALRILKHVRDTWQQAVSNYRAEQAGRAAPAVPSQGISVQA